MAGLKLTPQDYAQIDEAVKPTGTEVYSVVTHKHRGQYKRSVHVFQRMPNEYEMQAYENTATSVKFRNKDATVKSNQVIAAKTLYDQLVSRAYDVPYGTRVLDELDAQKATAYVDVLTKQKAMQELVGQVWGASSFDDEDDEKTEDPKSQAGPRGLPPSADDASKPKAGPSVQ